MSRHKTATKQARSLKFWISKLDIIYFLYNKNKAIDWPAQLICAFVLVCAENRFANDTAHIISLLSYDFF